MHAHRSRRATTGLVLGAALVMLDMSSVRSSAQPPTPGRARPAAKGRDRSEIDLADLRTGRPDAGAANRKAIEAALATGAEVLRLPEGDTYLDKPVWWASGRSLVGPRAGRATLRMAPGRDDGPLLLIPRDPLDQRLRTEQFPDSFGRLDPSAAPAAGKRWGYRTGPDSHLAQSAGVLSVAAAYWELRQVTIEAILDTTGAPMAAAGSILGLSTPRGEPSPWVWISDGAGRSRFLFRTRDASPFGGTTRSFAFAMPAGRGVHRFAFQLDLDAAKVGAWVDGAQLEIDANGLGADFTAESKLTLAPNQDAPFLFGSSGGSALTDTAEHFNNTKQDLTLLGLRIGQGLRYKVGSAGDPLRRLDGRPVNDHALCFEADGPTIAWLPLDDPPDRVVAERFLTVQTLASRGVALILSAAHARPECNLGGITLRDFSIRGGNPWSGIGVAMANTLHVRLADLSIADVAIPVSCIGTAANYPVLIERCVLNGTDCAAMSRYGMWTIRDCHSGRAGRTLFRADRAAQVRIDGWFCEGVGTPLTIFQVTDGCRVAVRNLDVDFEDNRYPDVAAFYATPGGHHARTGSLHLETIGFGAIPKTVPFVWLDGSPGVSSNATFGMRDVTIATAPSAWVRVTSPAWSGGFSAGELIQGWPSVPIEWKASGRARVKLRD